MNGDAARQLDVRLTAVRAAVETRDVDRAEVALDDLRRAVHRLRHDAALSDERAADILDAAGAVGDQLVTITTTTTTSTTTTTAPVPPPVDDHRGPGQKHQPGKEPGKEKAEKGKSGGKGRG
jgi:hypothetical protein